MYRKVISMRFQQFLFVCLFSMEASAENLPFRTISIESHKICYVFIFIQLYKVFHFFLNFCSLHFVSRQQSVLPDQSRAQGCNEEAIQLCLQGRHQSRPVGGRIHFHLPARRVRGSVERGVATMKHS